jgi:DNA ligase-1
LALSTDTVSVQAWRNQAGAPVNARSCKHLASLLGAEYETARLQWKNPGGPIPKAPGAKKGKAKGKDGDGEEGEGIPGLLLATKWDIEGGADPTGWWISEKLDGVRAYYDGKGGFWSRLGNPFAPPQWFTDALPKGITLDGELFAGRGQFQDTVSIVKTANSPHWKNVSFQVFDVPSKGEEPFEERIEYLRELFEYDVEVTVEEGGEGEGEKEGGEKKKSYKCEHVKVLEQVAAKSKEHVVEKLKEVEGLGGEGVMLRKPGS